MQLRILAGKRALMVLSLGFLWCGAGRAVAQSAGFIRTVAGNGQDVYNGEGVPALSAGVGNPHCVIADTQGNFYIADYVGNRVRKVSAATGLISAVAGTGAAGYNGDEIPATAAQLNGPVGLALDSGGNLYIADSKSHRIRQVSAASGLISTVAGTGVAGYNGEAMRAGSARLNTPLGVAVGPGDALLIVDSANNRVRRVNSSGVLTTVAGSGTYGYNGDGIAATGAQIANPYFAATDAAGNVFIGDYGNHRVRKVDASGIITTVAGNGTRGYNGDGIAATAASLYSPLGVAVDAAGNLFIADFENHRVRQVSAADGLISTVAGTGVAGYNGDNVPAVNAKLHYPESVGVDAAGHLLIADRANHRIRKVFGAAVSGLSLSVTNAPAVDEGSALAPGAATFAVKLSLPQNSAVSVNYKTVDNTAKAGSDYLAQSGTLTFAPGETDQTVHIAFLGDSAVEANETFFLDIRTPGAIEIADSRASAYVRNDDGPILTIENAPPVVEGNPPPGVGGTRAQAFTVRLSAPLPHTVTVAWATRHGTAGPNDYEAAAGTLIFAPGQTSRLIVVQVKKDTLVEPDESYRVTLKTPTYAVIGSAQASGTIVNDDSPPAAEPSR